MKSVLALVVSLGLVGCQANESQLERMFHVALSTDQNRTLPPQTEFFSVLSATIPTLNQRDASRLTSLTSRCLRSQDPEVQRFGVLYFLSVSAERMDSGVLLDSGIADMLAFAADPNLKNEELRAAALFGIYYLKPMPDKAIKGLVSLIENDVLSEPWIGSIAAALVSRAPADAEMLRMILTRVKRLEDPQNSVELIRWLGLASPKPSHPEAIAFIAESLENKDSRIRKAAVEAAGRLPDGSRSSLLYRLGQIATDKNESEALRSDATAALKQHHD